MDGVKLTFEPAALDYIVDKAIEFKLGARGLRSIVETIMMNSMYDIPSTQKNFLLSLLNTVPSSSKQHTSTRRPSDYATYTYSNPLQTPLAT